MTERLLLFIWHLQYFNKQSLQAATGESLQIIFPGERNNHQGPDFKQARIRINNILWAGEVELHLKSSDWHRHHHTRDVNYSKVILHVVWENDRTIIDQTGHPILTLELQNRVSHLLLSRYENWMQQPISIVCSEDISLISNIIWESWKGRLLIERLQQKTALISHLLQQTKNNWEEVFWQLLCRYFGTPINIESFKQLASSLPMKILARHKNQLHQLEALLLGQSGLLNHTFNEHYPLLLQREYHFFKKKYKLETITKAPVFLRMRPVNFPTIRLAQLAMLIHQSTHLFLNIIESNNIKTLIKLLTVVPNHFWNNHYQLNEISRHQPKKIGIQMISTLLINVIIPIVFTYGKYMGEEFYCDKALRWLEEIKAERNNTIQLFTDLKIISKTAFDSQSLLQLKKNYCDQKRCLECAIGNALLKKHI